MAQPRRASIDSKPISTGSSPTLKGTPVETGDPELEAAVAAAEATRAKPRTRANSKQTEAIRMLQRPEGATTRQICQVTGWQAHTVRGTFAGAFKKKGYPD